MKFKKAVTSTLALSLILTSSLPVKASIFSDIDGHWASSQIIKLAESGIVTGVNGEFNPNKPITKNEIQDIFKNANIQSTTLGNGTENITREEIAKVMAEILELPTTDTQTSFADDSSINEKGSVNAVYKAGIMIGKNNNIFDPQGSLTRAEMVTLIENALPSITTIINSDVTTSEIVTETPQENTKMFVTSTGIVDGIIDDKFGKFGESFNENGMPNYSLPFKVENAPEGTVSYAIVLEDKDTFPITNGFTWIHWTAANITRDEVMENESQTATDFVQGANSMMSKQGGEQSRELSSFYGGMMPPNAPHTYELTVYALDTILDLENGFNHNDLHKMMDGHIVDNILLKVNIDINNIYILNLMYKKLL